MPMLERPEGEIFYYDCDTVAPWIAPQTVVFLNGLATDSNIWATWVPHLADRYRVIRIDLRGFGRSFRPSASAPWSIEALGCDVLDVLDALGLERVHFVGESTGGTVGLHLAATHPDRLLTLTTVSAAHRGDAIQRAKALRDEVHTLGMDAWSDKAMGLRFHPGALTSEMYEWFHDTQRGSAPEACVALVDMLVDCDLTASLPDIATRTLILAPDDSPFVTLEAQVERLRAMPNATMHVISNARHGVAFSHGPVCAEAFKTFAAGSPNQQA